MGLFLLCPETTLLGCSLILYDVASAQPSSLLPSPQTSSPGIPHWSSPWDSEPLKEQMQASSLTDLLLFPGAC